MPGTKVVGEHFGIKQVGVVVRVARGGLREALIRWPDGRESWKRLESLSPVEEVQEMEDEIR